LPAQVTRIQGRLAFVLNPTLPSALAAAAIAGQIQQAYIKNGIATTAASAADLIRQNAVLNAINDSSNLTSQKVNDPASMVLAVGRAQAVAQQNATWLNYGKVAEQALPVFRNVIEAITYALFPLFVLLLLLTSGRETMMAVKGYAATLIWIQLWPPLYAVLNYMASTYAAYDLAAAADLGTGAKALTLQTASTIYSRAVSGEAVVGYLAMSIPFIAWAALKRMENFGTALAGGLSGLQGTLSGSTGAAAVGNVSLGNVAMDQMQLAPNRTSAFMGNWQHDLSGNTFSTNALSGRTAVSLLRNQGFASRVVSMRVSEQDVQEAHRQVDAARTEAVSASTERAAVLTDAFSKGMAKLRSSRSSSGSTSSSFEQSAETLNKLDQISRSVAETTGLSQSQIAHIVLGAAGHVGLNARLFGGQLNASASKTYLSSLSVQDQRVLQSLTSEQLAAFKQFGDRLSRDQAFVHAISDDSRESHELASRMSSATSRTQRAEATLVDRLGHAKRVSSAKESGEAIAIDIAQDPHNLEMFSRYAAQYGGSSASAHALMAAELARRAPAPTRVLADGFALPVTFEEPRQQHNATLAHRAFDDDLDAHTRSNEDRVRQAPEPRTAKDLPPTPGTLRGQVLDAGASIRKRTSSELASSVDKVPVERTTSGALQSRVSVLGRSAAQAAADAASTASAVQEVVKGLIGKR
jgi:conjugal transfer mating pair stabilization protein TraG